MLEEIYLKFVKQVIKNYEEENDVEVKKIDLDYLADIPLRELYYDIYNYIKKNAEVEEK